MEEEITPGPTSKPEGSHMLRNLVVILAVVALAVLGWWSFNNKTTDTTSQTEVDTSVPEVTKKDDLTGAKSFITDSEIDSALDTSEIDSVLN